ncbi:MAG: M23 family metallopeptidase [Oscillibacter sp.]|nr:M23 family metallopeptidase [Oscillibacter sp.]
MSQGTDKTEYEHTEANETERPRRRERRARSRPQLLEPLRVLAQKVRGKIHWFRRRTRRVIREARARRFPESNRFLVQAVLFAWGAAPAGLSLLTERVLGRRKKQIHRSHHVTAWFEQTLHRHAPLVLGGCTLLAALILTLSFFTVATTVKYNGKTLATVASRRTAERVREDVETVTARTLAQSYSVDRSLLEYDAHWAARRDVADAEEYEEALMDELGLVTEAYCLYIDGEILGATPYEGALEELLKQLQDKASNEDTISCSFKEQVEVRREYVPTEQVMNLGNIAELLFSTKVAEQTYTVKKGDVWSKIAEKNGMTSKELLALNPGYNINKIRTGEVLTVAASVPYLTMTTVQQERYLEDQPYEISYTDDPDLYQGDYKITSRGEYGKVDVMAMVTYVNGVETERTILSSVTLKEPVTEYRLQGTKPRPTWYPTGSFRWPVNGGRITSYFGGRRSPGGIGSTNHKGIDIAAPYGTTIYASDGGTVVHSGWMSGYGYLVEIQHSNGYTTRYGHCSSLLVSVGAHVYKGQAIARVGSTGNSTGNHCHFEIRLNGVARNPLNYL